MNQTVHPRCPEIELLICCARTELSASVAERIHSLLEQEIDWRSLVQLAARHRIRPLLYWHLKELSKGRVPSEVLQHLEECFRGIVQFNLYLTQELLELVSLFKDHAVEAIPFKGPVLTQAIYGNLALREFGDLDMLIAQRHVSKVKDLLIDRGFETLFQLSSRQELGYLESQCEYYFVRSDRQLPVEIHWRLFPRYFTFAMDLDSVRERLVSVSLCGKQLSTLSPEDLLLYLCAHGTKHSWSRLGWISDISELLRAYPQLGWDEVMNQARSLGGERMLYLGLHLAHELLGTELPKEIEREIQRDATLSALVRQVRQSMVQEKTVSTGDPDFRGLLFSLRARERLRDRVRYCLRLMMFPTDGERWSRVNLPTTLLPFYYLLWRPIGLMMRAGSYLVGHLLWSDAAVRKPG